jgi:hypothetical protein
MKLLVVTPFNSKDFQSAIRLYNWIKELGGIDNDVLLVHDPQDDRLKCNRVLLAAKRAAKSVTVIQTPGTHKREWPHGPNAAFLSASKYALDNKRDFLWLETDCVPTKSEWLAELETEYKKCGKQYLGGIVECHPPLPSKVMYGVAVYHHTAFSIASKAIADRPELAFDVSMSPSTVKSAEPSKLIQLSAKDKKHKVILGSGVALYHPEKSGSLIEMLKGRTVSDKDDIKPLPSRHIDRMVNNKNTTIDRPCFVQLGRIGDILNIIPVLRFWSSICYNEKIPMLVYSDYLHVLSRIGYIHQLQWTGDLNDLKGATEYAKSMYDKHWVCQLFSNEGLSKPILSNYNLDQWYHCGEHNNFKAYPLEFDQRNYKAEEQWFAKNRKTSNPLICYNLDGTSSPFYSKDAVLAMLNKKFGDCELWNLSDLRTGYYSDQLIALDRCDALVTIDTSTLHLAQASHCRYIAMLSNTHGNGWSATKTRRDAELSVGYGDVKKSMREIESSIRKSIDKSSWKPNRVWHVVQRRHVSDGRVSRAEQQWNRLYADGVMSPIHVWSTNRNAKDSIKDKRSLPYLRDVLSRASSVAGPDDVILFTNDDIAITKRCVDDVVWKLKYTPIVTGGRVDVDSQIDNGFASLNGYRHLGRDLVAFRASHLNGNLNKIPDFVIGASEWDIVVAVMARNLCGFKSIDKNIGFVSPDCELSPGTIFHEKHDAFWQNGDNVKSAPSQIHNRKLAEEWFRYNASGLRFHWFNRI